MDCLRFYVFDDRGHANFRAGVTDLGRVLVAGAARAGRSAEPVADVVERITDLGYEWGSSDGN